MSTSVTLPALGESVTEGTVSRWLKQVGDTVETDEPLLEVSTDKVDTEIPSPASGVLLEIKAQEDETVEVGAVLAVIGEPSESDGQAAAPEAPTEEAAEPPAKEEAPQEEAQPAEPPQEPEAAAAEAPAEPTAPAASSGGQAAGTEVALPELGESVTEGTISRWLKQVGDSVVADEPLLEVSTDKVDTEIPSPTSGTLLEIRVQEDETVEVGAVLAIIGEAGAAAPSPGPEPQAEPERQPEQERRPEPRAQPTPQPEPGPHRSRSPRSRRLLQRKTPDLNTTVRQPRLPVLRHRLRATRIPPT
jgi:pyruvate dehydrogenase E2 component (dihydrolipoyllysine-residue acetyltransferase)